MEAAADKRELRKQLREKLAGLSQDYSQAGTTIRSPKIFLALEEYRQATMIFCFVGVGREDRYTALDHGRPGCRQTDLCTPVHCQGCYGSL